MGEKVYPVGAGAGAAAGAAPAGAVINGFVTPGLAVRLGGGVTDIGLVDAGAATRPAGIAPAETVSWSFSMGMLS